ncbi:MAG TPA: hypothetical protein VFO55_11935 [Gemmatimonadaceae bacterium]|nr:hypothetical protein [Gemmatimonadaceae bacterium]
MKERKAGSLDGRIEQAKDAALGSHKGPPSTIDEIGEAAGGISGTLLGAGIGAAGGPAGALIGGIAGALGGWWAGRAVTEAAERLSEDDHTYFRQHFERHPERPATQSYEDARTAYVLGHIASENPNFTAREFDEVEPELRRGWEAQGDRRDDWETARAYAREAFARNRERRAKETLADQITPRRPDERRR